MIFANVDILLTSLTSSTNKRKPNSEPRGSPYMTCTNSNTYQSIFTNGILFEKRLHKHNCLEDISWLHITKALLKSTTIPTFLI